MTFYLLQALNGLAYWMLLFLLAAGLSLIFGLMEVVNLAHGGFYMLGAYLALSAGVVVGLLPTWALLAMASLPLLVRQIRSSELGATGQQRAIAMIDLETAQLHAAFGFLLVSGLVVAALLAR